MNLSGVVETTLGELAVFEMGQAPPGAECNKDGNGTVFVKAGEFGDLFPVQREWTTRPLKFGKSGDVFICVVGATSGKLNLGIDCAIGRSVAGIRPKEGVDTRFIYYQLHPWVLKLRASSAGSAQGVISKQQLSDIPIRLVSFEQQTRIVAEIEKQFSRLDEAVANLKRVKANLKRYKAAVLKAAVEGKLTEEWRRGAACCAHGVSGDADQGTACRAPTETGAELLQRILAERRKAAGKGKYKEPVAPENDNLPELPVGWVWARLDTIAALKGGITVDKKRKDPTARLVPYLRVANVQRGYLDLTEMKEIEAPKSVIEELRLLSGDILFNEGGDRDKLGRGWVWEGQIADCIHQNHVFRARLFLSEMPAKLISWWGNSFGKDYFLRAGKQTTNLASINLSKLSEFPVPLPPLAEQHQIVAEVERRLSIIAGAEVQVDANLRRADRLRQSILKQAFSGQLVHQDPNDEPASALLERVRANTHVGARHAVPLSRTVPLTQSERPKRARHAVPLRETEPTPAAPDFASLDSVLAAILNRMQPAREYSRAEIADALGLTTGRWNAAIQELKRRGQVRQVGEKRGARYVLSERAEGNRR